MNGGDHLQNASRNVTYISRTTQNEIISIIGELIQRNIVKDCKTTGGFFSISADEVRDIGDHEQLALRIRCVDKENQIREEFLAFIDVSEETTGEFLSKELLSFICEVGLDPTKMRIQCYDGAGNMSGKI